MGILCDSTLTFKAATRASSRFVHVHTGGDAEMSSASKTIHATRRHRRAQLAIVVLADDASASRCAGRQHGDDYDCVDYAPRTSSQDAEIHRRPEQRPVAPTPRCTRCGRPQTARLSQLEVDGGASVRRASRRGDRTRRLTARHDCPYGPSHQREAALTRDGDARAGGAAARDARPSPVAPARGSTSAARRRRAELARRRGDGVARRGGADPPWTCDKRAAPQEPGDLEC